MLPGRDRTGGAAEAGAGTAGATPFCLAGIGLGDAACVAASMRAGAGAGRNGRALAMTRAQSAASSGPSLRTQPRQRSGGQQQERGSGEKLAGESDQVVPPNLDWFDVIFLPWRGGLQSPLVRP